jgi:demethoxyubiquinone hydroxylase (CLK1/Coq7/Cat5 family)
MSKLFSNSEELFNNIFKKRIDKKIKFCNSQIETKEFEIEEFEKELAESQRNCHANDYNYRSATKRLNKVIEICMECCTTLGYEGELDEQVLADEPNFLERDMCCCDELYQLSNLNLKAQSLISTIKLNLDINEDSENEGRYTIGKRTDLSYEEAEEIQQDVTGRLDKAEELYIEADELYQKCFDEMKEKMQDRDNIEAEIEERKNQIEVIRNKIVSFEECIDQKELELSELKIKFEEALEEEDTNNQKIAELKSELKILNDEMDSVNQEPNPGFFSKIWTACKFVVGALACLGIGLFGIVFTTIAVIAMIGSEIYKKLDKKKKLRVLEEKKNEINNQINELDSDELSEIASELKDFNASLYEIINEKVEFEF